MTLPPFEQALLVVVVLGFGLAAVQYARGVVGEGRLQLVVGALLAALSTVLVELSVEGVVAGEATFDLVTDVLGLLAAVAGLYLLYRSLRLGWWREGTAG